MRKDHEIIVKCRWGSGGAVPSTVGSLRGCGGGSAGKDSYYGHKNIILISGIHKPANLSEINFITILRKKFLLEISKFKKLHLTRESSKTKYYQHYSKFDSNSFSSALSR